MTTTAPEQVPTGGPVPPWLSLDGLGLKDPELLAAMEQLVQRARKLTQEVHAFVAEGEPIVQRVSDAFPVDTPDDVYSMAWSTTGAREVEDLLHLLGHMAERFNDHFGDKPWFEEIASRYGHVVEAWGRDSPR